MGVRKSGEVAKCGQILQTAPRPQIQESPWKTSRLIHVGNLFKIL